MTPLKVSSRLKECHFSDAFFERRAFVFCYSDNPYAFYSLKEFEDDLWRHRLEIGSFLRLVRNDLEVYPCKGPARQDSLRWVLDRFSEGFSIVFNNLNLVSASIAAVASDMEAFYRCKAFATAFLTPAADGCFSYHYDEVDVFLLQVFGEKTWDVAFPVQENPTEGSQKTNVEQDKVRPYLSAALQAGDCLYIPRGHIHRGRPGRVGSLHISIGLHTTTLLNEAQRLLTDLSASLPIWRRGSLGDTPLNLNAALIVDSLNHSQVVARPLASVPAASPFLPGTHLETLLRYDSDTSAVLPLKIVSQIPYTLATDLSVINISGRVFDYGLQRAGPVNVALPAGYFVMIDYLNRFETFTCSSVAGETKILVADVTSALRMLVSAGFVTLDSN